MFATKPQLARERLARSLDAKPPATRVTADEVDGSDHHFRTFCEFHAAQAPKASANTMRPS